MNEQHEQIGSGDIAEVRWAPRVNPDRIRRLYESDARGIVDEDLIEDVGLALYARCRSILTVTEAHAGRVHCPRCARGGTDTVISHPWEGELICPQCSWRVWWQDYLKTYQSKHLHGGGAVEMFRAFMAQYDQANSPRQKLLAIDRLIHCFHWELVKEPGRTVGKNLIYGRNTQEILAFLDTLTYGEAGTPELRQIKKEWEYKLQRSERSQQTGYRREP